MTKTEKVLPFTPNLFCLKNIPPFESIFIKNKIIICTMKANGKIHTTSVFSKIYFIKIFLQFSANKKPAISAGYKGWELCERQNQRVGGINCYGYSSTFYLLPQSPHFPQGQIRPPHLQSFSPAAFAALCRLCMYGVSPLSLDSPGHGAGLHISLMSLCDFFNDFECLIQIHTSTS